MYPTLLSATIWGVAILAGIIITAVQNARAEEEREKEFQEKLRKMTYIL